MKYKFNYVYKTTNLINNKFYYGIHSTNDLEDGYIGSGTLLKKAIKKYGKNNFVKEILIFYNTREEALFAERLIITEHDLNNEMCYNMKNGGEGGAAKGRMVTEETRNKISNAQKGKRKHSGFSEKRRIAQTGKRHSYATRKKMSDSRKGERNIAFGKPSHRRNNDIWDQYDFIKKVWNDNNQPGYYTLNCILMQYYNFPSYNYQKMVLKFKS